MIKRLGSSFFDCTVLSSHVFDHRVEFLYPSADGACLCSREHKIGILKRGGRKYAHGNSKNRDDRNPIARSHAEVRAERLNNKVAGNEKSYARYVWDGAVYDFAARIFQARSDSREILREFGNVSSPSVFFVLEAALKDSVPPGYWWLSAFGAGFSCHGALLEVG